MPDELTELWDTAIYKEIASQAVYEAGWDKTGDEGARTLLHDLAREEKKHARWLQAFKEGGLDKLPRRTRELPDLKLSEYLTGGDTLVGAGLQDVLIFAMKREQQAVEFYARLTGVLRDEAAKRLCQRLVHQELKHKLRLELFYDSLFYGED
ncbi:MAG: ferritin family protein [Chloroflexota bacterium]